MNDPQLKEKALSAGADAFFPKPVEMREFLEISFPPVGINIHKLIRFPWM